MKLSTNKKKIYFLSILISLSIVLFFFSLQVVFVLKEFKVEFAVVPTLLGLTIGFLVAKVYILKKELELEKKLFHTIANEAREFSYFKSIDGSYQYISPAVKDITGYVQEDFYKEKDFLNTLVLDEDKTYWNTHLAASQNTDSAHANVEFRIKNKNGQEIWIDHNCAPVYEDGVRIGVRSSNSNITKRKEDELAIETLNRYDTLTGIPNRKFIFEKFAELQELKIPFSIIFLDLNRFKKVNDSLGHVVGDLVLKSVAQNFTNCNHENIFIGRLGGDEFLIILENITKKDEIDLYAKRIYTLVAKDYTIEDYTFYIGASMGVARYPAETKNIHDLLAYADKAMYKAKQISSSDIVYYSDLMQDNPFDEFLLEKELREAIKNNSLEIFMQPKFDTKLEKIVGYEALIRWKKDEIFISPDVFIPLSEETGLIREITLYVIEEVFSVAKRFKSDNISINLSMIDLMSDTFVDKVSALLEKYDVNPKQFEFELTERIFFENNQRIENNINSLIAIGFEIALDDFGTGYSSLSYLTKLPINTLKIDKTFIDNLDTQYKKNFPLLKSIVTIAKDLKYKIVIEGVETKEQLDILNSIGEFVVQGYYFYKPMSIAEIENLT